MRASEIEADADLVKRVLSPIPRVQEAGMNELWVRFVKLARPIESRWSHSMDKEGCRNKAFRTILVLIGDARFGKGSLLDPWMKKILGRKLGDEEKGATASKRDRRKTRHIDWLDKIAAKASSAWRKVQREDVARIVNSKLDALRPEMRSILKLYFFDELGYDEIATKLSITIAAARARVHRAVSELRERLDTGSNLELHK
jgi:RNA polymerase sigma factor (sigma-70 family)